MRLIFYLPNLAWSIKNYYLRFAIGGSHAFGDGLILAANSLAIAIVIKDKGQHQVDLR